MEQSNPFDKPVDGPWAFQIADSTPPSPWLPFGRWMVNAFCWDGILPLFIMVLPRVSRFLFPGHPLLIDLMAVAVPIGALFFRIVVGKRHIDTNSCGPTIRLLQYWTLGVSAFLLLAVEPMVILMIDFPALAFPANDTEYNILLFIFSAYFLGMIFAQYPGQGRSKHR